MLEAAAITTAIAIGVKLGFFLDRLSASWQ